MPDPGSAPIRFGRFELLPAGRQLLEDGQPLKLGGRAFDLLVALAERRDRVVSKNELMDIVWPRLVVEENNLQVQVLTLRKLLGPQVIATVPGRGYRFTAALEAGAGPSAPAPAPPGAEGPRLIGRERDLADLHATLRTQRLVTLLGAGGVGKSTLARHVATALQDGFEDGVFWVDLTPLDQPAAVVEAIVTATRSTLPRGDRLPALGAALRPQHALLVIDNAEHLLEEVTRVAQALHEAAPRLHLLVTSQAPLRLRAEQLLRLEPLTLADPDATLHDAALSPAVQLFVERVRASDRHFVLDDLNRAAVVALTRRLDGLPLAIEMAAARVPALSPAQLDEALRERFRVLTRGDPLAPARQHTLQAAMQWTHGLLSPNERAVFRRLAVFVGGFSLPAAQQVCRDDDSIDEWQVLDALAVLVDRSLVTPPVGEPPRYRLLDTPQAFARQQLAASGEEAPTRARHGAYFRSHYEAAYEEHLWRRQSVDRWLDAYAVDADNGLAALSHALATDKAAALALVPGLAQALVSRHAERFAIWRRTEPLVDAAVPDDVRARWQLGFAQFWGVNSNEQRSRPAARAAAEHFRRVGHAAAEYRAQAMLATTLSDGQAPGVQAALARLAELEQPHWSGDLRFLRRWAEATCLSSEGRYAEALAVGHECLALIRESGRSGRLIHEMGMMFVEIMADRLDEAIERGVAAVRRMRARHRHAPASGAELLLLAAWLLRGDTPPARQVGPAVWEAGSMFNQKAAVADTLSLLAAAEGRPRASMLLVGFAVAEYARSGTNRLDVYRRCAEEAQATAERALGAEACAALQARGAGWPDEGIAMLAFGAADLQPEIS